MSDEIKNLRQFIKYFLRENKKDILGEPDLSSENERENSKDRDEFFRSMIPKGGNNGAPEIKLGLSMPSFSGKKEKKDTNTATVSNAEEEKDIDEINTVASVGLSGPPTPLGTGPDGKKKNPNPYDPERPY